MVFETEFGYTAPTLPLKQSARIVAGNATQIDWELVCPLASADEVYLIGNPPYLGARMQNKKHKSDILNVFGNLKGANSLDYIACWFYLASKYIQHNNAKFAFVSTNSLCQGEQVGILWPRITDLGLEINFAHRSFKWQNHAKKNAAVICIIVGIQNADNKPKYIYNDILYDEVKKINPYLSEGTTVYINRRSAPISKMPTLVFGSMPNDGGHLILSKEEFIEAQAKNTIPDYLIKRFMGAQEFLNGNERW
jgi:type II restriction/modification system DNA methylase subunit YeeA